MTLTIRAAVKDDLAAVSRIYNHYVTISTATFATEEESENERREWFERHRSGGYPVIVGMVDGEVVGWASLSQYHTRCAYRQTAEPSVYVSHEYLRHGFGRLLVEHLLNLASDGQFHSLVALICSENVQSLNLIRSFGFEEVGVLKEVGRKFDRWLDVTLMQKQL